MEILTKHNIDDTVYYLERKRISEQCPACNGWGRMNVTNGVHSWNIKCPDCNGKKKIFQTIRYEVVSGIVEGVIVKRGERYSTKYVLKSGMHKQETALYSTIEEAKVRCKELNEQIKK